VRAPPPNTTFYSTAAQVLPVLFLATALEGGVLWRFGRPLLDEIDADSRAVVERIASFALLLLIAIVMLGEAQALYRLTGKTFLFAGDQPIYLALWAAGSGIVLPYVLAQVRLAARATGSRRRPRVHLLFAAALMGLYFTGAALDTATRL
jgi:hypothetical protein